MVNTADLEKQTYQGLRLVIDSSKQQYTTVTRDAIKAIEIGLQNLFSALIRAKNISGAVPQRVWDAGRTFWDICETPLAAC